MKRFRDVGFRCIAATLIAALVAGCSGGSPAQSTLPSTTSSLPAGQPIAHSQLGTQASGFAAFVIPSVNGAQYNVAQWSSVYFPASHSSVFVGTDSYNNVAYSFTVTYDPASGYFQFSTSDGMFATRATASAQTYTVSKGTNPNRDMNLLTALKFDMTDAELGGGGGGGKPGGPQPASAGSKAAQSSQQVDALVKGLVLVGGVILLGAAILAIPALAAGATIGVAAAAIGGSAVLVLAAAVDYANTVAGPSEGNGSGPIIDPPSSNGPPSVSDFCRPYTYEGIPGLYCTFYY